MKTVKLSDIGTVKNTKKFDVVRTNLLLNLGDKKIISVLPTAWSQEVFELTVQLAKSLARGQRNVLLINADAKNQDFLEDDETGLFSVLTGKSDLAASVCATDINGLSVLSIGEQPEYTTELLSGIRFTDLLKELKEQYDYVFILLPAIDQSLDGIVASSKTDGCMVITSTNTAFNKIKEPVEMLQKGTDLIGTILVKNASPWKPKFSFRK